MNRYRFCLGGERRERRETRERRENKYIMKTNINIYSYVGVEKKKENK